MKYYISKYHSNPVIIECNSDKHRYIMGMDFKTQWYCNYHGYTHHYKIISKKQFENYLLETL